MSSENDEPKMPAAERAVSVGVVAGLGETLEPERELPATEDEGAPDTDRVRRDRGPLDDLVWVTLDQQVVLERRRLALVAVHDEVGRLRRAQHRPLAARRETGAATTEQARPVHLVAHGLRLHPQRLAQRPVPAGREVALERVRVVVAEPLVTIAARR